MNKIRTRLLTVLLTGMMSTIIFPVAAFAGGGEMLSVKLKAPPSGILF